MFSWPKPNKGSQLKDADSFVNPSNVLLTDSRLGGRTLSNKPHILIRLFLKIKASFGFDSRSAIESVAGLTCGFDFGFDFPLRKEI